MKKNKKKFLKQTRKIYKKPLFDKIANIIEKKFGVIIVVFLILAVGFPVVVWLCYSVVSCKIYTDISADGMLGYLGTVLGSFSSVFVAFIAIYQSNRSVHLEELSNYRLRKKEICPSLQIEINIIQKNIYELQITNYGQCTAIDIYIFEYAFIHHVSAGETKRKRFTVGISKCGVLSIDESYIEINSGGFPQIITLVYGDIDFRSGVDGKYDAQDPEEC